jgi:hypothetical protein
MRRRFLRDLFSGIKWCLMPASSWFLVKLTLRLWGRRRYVPPNRRLSPNYMRYIPEDRNLIFITWFSPSAVQILSFVLCSQTTTIYFLLLGGQSKFNTHAKNLIYVTFFTLLSVFCQTVLIMSVFRRNHFLLPKHISTIRACPPGGVYADLSSLQICNLIQYVMVYDNVRVFSPMRKYATSRVRLPMRSLDF